MEHYGLGRHVEEVPLKTVSNLLKVRLPQGRLITAIWVEPLIWIKTVFAFIPIFATTVLVIKASIILFLRQIFPRRRVLVSLYVISGIVFAWWAVAVFMGIFLCNVS